MAGPVKKHPGGAVSVTPSGSTLLAAPGLDPADFAQFLDFTHDGVWRVDVSPSVSTRLAPREQAEAILHRARLSFCNVALARLVGLETPDDLLGQPLSALLTGDHEEQVRFVAASIAHGYLFRDAEAPMQHADGHIIWTCSNVVGVVKRGRLSGGWGTTRDITSQKSAEAALAEASAKLHATISAFPDLLFEVDAEGRIHDYQASNPAQLYAPPASFLGKRLSEVLPPAIADSIMAALETAVREGSSRGTRYSLDLPAGRRTFELTIAAKGSGREADARFAAMARDVTEGEDALAALRRSEERLRLALAATSDGIYDVDFATGAAYYSPGYASMLGFSPDELSPSQTTWERLLHPEDREGALRVLEECLAGPRDELEMEFRLRAKGGDWRWIHSRARVVARDADGRAQRVVGTHRDITRRVLAREELQRQRDLAQLYLDTAQTILIVLDVDGRIELVNRRGCELLGCECPGALLGKDWFSNCLPERLAAETAAVFQQLVAGEVESAEYHENPVKTLSGEERLIAWHNALLRDARGRITGIVSSGQDITDQKAAQDARRESEERFRRIFEESPVGMVIAGPDYRFTKANAAFCRMLGYRESELLALRFIDVTHREHAEADLAGVERAARGESSVYRTEKRYLRKDGGVVWGAVSSVPIRDAEGRVQYFVAMIADVTAEREAKAALAESERRFRDLANALPTCVFEADLAGRITYANQTGLDWFGYSECEALGGIDLTQMVIPEQRDTAARTFRQAMDRGEVPSGEYMALRKDGTTFPGLVSSRALVRDGQTIGIRGILVDISERVESAHRIERALTGTVRALAATTEMRDPYTAGHQERVTLLALAIGRRMGFAGSRLEGLRVAGLLHDVGKASVPAEILSKPTELTAIELDFVRQHPATGYAILKEIDFPWPVAAIVLQHHERADGSGYPHGLRGEHILVEARILAVADTVEAMASHRPYRAALGLAKALAEVAAGRGTRYDAAVVDACLAVFAERETALGPLPIEWAA
ncbi:MAG: PAS domain S-box protein [Candidatus Bipolaricaulota bacterium]